MNELDVIATAMLAGAAAGTSDVASAAIRDAYSSLCQALRRRLNSVGHVTNGNGMAITAEVLLSSNERARVIEILSTIKAADDAAVVRDAQILLDLIGAVKSIGFNVVVEKSTGVQVGDNNSMNIMLDKTKEL